MSRRYRISIIVRGNMSRQVHLDIENALATEMFDTIGCWPKEGLIEADAEYNLGAGRTTKEEMGRLRGIIWRIAGDGVQVGFRAIYLEEDYEFSTDADFNEWKSMNDFAPRCGDCGCLLEEDDEDGLCFDCVIDSEDEA